MATPRNLLLSSHRERSERRQALWTNVLPVSRWYPEQIVDTSRHVLEHRCGTSLNPLTTPARSSLCSCRLLGPCTRVMVVVLLLFRFVLFPFFLRKARKKLRHWPLPAHIPVACSHTYRPQTVKVIWDGGLRCPTDLSCTPVGDQL